MSLTALATVKERLGIPTATTDWDALLATLILEVDGDLLGRMGRVIESASFTEYPDGDGTPLLMLDQGPLVSVTSVNAVEYSEGVAGARTETLTEIYPYQYLERALASENYIGRAYLEGNGWSWSPGRRNYKVEYVGGFAAVPKKIEKLATECVGFAFMTREALGMASKTIGDAQTNPLTPVQLDNAIERALRPYKVWHP